MSCEAEIRETLRRAGHKMTPQRLLIVSALRHAGKHMSAAAIADEVRETYPFVDVSTVYRTLDVLKRMRLATATDMGQGDVLFEWTPPQPHHHLICSDCGVVLEVDHEPFERLASSLRAMHDFEADLHHFAIFGLCHECQDGDAE